MAPSREIRLEDIPDDLKTEIILSKPFWTDTLKTWAEDIVIENDTKLLRLALPAFEKTMIEVALNKTGGKKSKAAKLLGWGRNTLSRKIKELGMS